MFKTFWSRLAEQIFSPRADSVQVEEQLRKARQSLPKPVIWLLGKTQSGKTSIIRAMTGSTKAEIGSGFRPCTRTAQTYAFPGEEDTLLHFLDTRGLGEANYNPAEDIAYCQQQAHLLMVVVRAMDHAVQPVLAPLAAIRHAKPQWPVIVVQTALHDGYPSGAAHVEPYPYDSDPWPASIPANLARSLIHQRNAFADLASRFVAVDFTLPEDGFTPEFYGLESLWNAIEAELPIGLRAMLGQHPDLQSGLSSIYARTALPHIMAYAILAGGGGAVPVVNIAIVVGVQAKMFQTIASIYEQPFSARVLREFGAAIGTGFLVGLVGRSLLAWAPVVGSAIAAVYAAATTFALGVTWCWYLGQIKRGITPSAEKVREIFASEMQEGRRRFTEYLKQTSNTNAGGG